MAKWTKITFGSFWKRFLLNDGLISHMAALLLFLAITFLVFRNVVFSPGVIGMEGEWGIPPFSSQYKLNFLYPWTSNEYGSPSYSPGIHYKIFLFILASIGMNGEAISKVVIIMVMSLAGYSGFYLARRLNLKKSSSVFAGFLYMMSPVMYDRLCYGQLPIQLDYALFPFLVAFFLKSIYYDQKNWLRNLVVTGLLLGLMTQPTDIALGFIMLFLVSIVYLGKRDVSFRTCLRALLVVTFITCLINAYLLIPWFSDIKEMGLTGLIYTTAGRRSPELIAAPGAPLIDAFRSGVHGGFPYFDNALYSLGNGIQVWEPISFLLVILAFCALLFEKRKRIALFSSLWVVVAVTLAAANEGPLGSAYFAMVKLFPPLIFFRTTTRWYPMLILGYSLLLGVFFECMNRKLGFLSSKVHEPRKSQLLPTSLSVWCISLIMIVYLIFFGTLASYLYPFYGSGNFNGSLHTYVYDKEYYDLFNWLNNQPEDFRVFMLPAPYPTLYDGATYSLSPGYDMMTQYAGKPTIYTGLPYYPPMESFLIKSMYENRSQYLSKLLGLSSIKYIIFDTNKQTLSTRLSPGAGGYPEMEFTNEKIMNTLNQQLDLQLMDTRDVNGNPIYIFRNNDYLPHLQSVGSIGLFAGDLTGLVSISYMQDLKLEENALVFVDQLSPEDLVYLANLSNVKFIIQDGYFSDLVFALVPQEYKLDPIEYRTSSSPTDGWALYECIWYNWYYQGSLERLLWTQKDGSEFSVPFTAKTEGEYDIYLKAYQGPKGAALDVYLDQAQLERLYTNAPSEIGFRWFSISAYLEPGSHELSIKNYGENLISGIVIVPKNIVQRASDEVNDLMKDKQVILFSEAKLQEVSAETAMAFGNDSLGSWTANYLGEGEMPIVSRETGIIEQGNNSLEAPAGNSSLRFEVPVNEFAYIDHVFDISQDWSKYDSLSFWWYDKAGGELSVRLEDSNQNPREWRPRCLLGWTHFYFPLQQPEFTWGRPANLSDIVKIRIAKEGVGLYYLTNFELVNQIAEVKEIGVSASEGEAIRIKRGSQLNQSLCVPKSGLYKLYIRAGSDIPNSSLSLKVNRQEYNVSLSTGFEWIEAGDPYLDENSTNISFLQDMRGNVYLDQILLLSPQGSIITPHIELNYEQNNPVSYRLSGDSNEPFYIFFSECFSQFWKITLDDGTVIRSFRGYSFGNLFYINRTGQFSGKLEFERTKEFDIGKFISFTTFGVLITTITVSRVRSKKANNQVEKLKNFTKSQKKVEF